MPPALVSKFIVSKDGTEIFAEAAGDPKKPSIVFVHGLASAAIIFDGIFNDSKWLDELYLIRYDLRGHGRSGKPLNDEAWETFRFAEDWDAVVTEFEVTKPFFAGWNYGGSVAADILEAYGVSAFSGIIYLASVPVIERHMLGAIGTSFCLGLVPGLLTVDDVIVSTRARAALVDSFVGDPTLLDFRTKALWIGLSSMLRPDITAKIFHRKQNLESLWEGGKSLPLLIVHGARDALINGISLIAATKPHFKDFEAKIIPDAGHASFIDKPDQVRDIVLTFVKRVGSQTII